LTEVRSDKEDMTLKAPNYDMFIEGLELWNKVITKCSSCE